MSEAAFECKRSTICKVLFLWCNCRSCFNFSKSLVSEVLLRLITLGKSVSFIWKFIDCYYSATGTINKKVVMKPEL